ncbi:MAG: hypothetical protein P3X22_007065 [Thermoprotei archaeon]|nr:hypothetical protein [Thermoprotei archaeon]
MVEEKSRVEALLAIFETLKEEDVEEIEETLKAVDLKNVAILLKELSENADSIISLIEVARMLKESGTLAALSGLLEVSDETFNAAARAELMKAVGNAMMLVYMLSLFNHGILLRAAETTPKCVEAAINEAAKTDKGLGLLELLRIMRSPEMAAALKSFMAMMRCLKGKP